MTKVLECAQKKNKDSVLEMAIKEKLRNELQICAYYLEGAMQDREKSLIHEIGDYKA
jgi:hypothetical protein